MRRKWIGLLAFLLLIAGCGAWVEKTGTGIRAPHVRTAEFNIGYQALFKCFDDTSEKPTALITGETESIIYSDLGLAEFRSKPASRASWYYLVVQFQRVRPDMTRVSAFEGNDAWGAPLGWTADVWPYVERCATQLTNDAHTS